MKTLKDIAKDMRRYAGWAPPGGVVTLRVELLEAWAAELEEAHAYERALEFVGSAMAAKPASIRPLFDKARAAETAAGAAAAAPDYITSAGPNSAPAATAGQPWWQREPSTGLALVAMVSFIVTFAAWCWFLFG